MIPGYVDGGRIVCDANRRKRCGKNIVPSEEIDVHKKKFLDHKN